MKMSLWSGSHVGITLARAWEHGAKHHNTVQWRGRRLRVAQVISSCAQNQSKVKRFLFFDCFFDFHFLVFFGDLFLLLFLFDVFLNLLPFTLYLFLPLYLCSFFTMRDSHALRWQRCKRHACSARTGENSTCSRACLAATTNSTIKAFDGTQMSRPTSENLSDTLQKSLSQADPHRCYRCVNFSVGNVEVDDIESWKTHEWVADHQRRERKPGSMKLVTSLKRDSSLNVVVEKFDSVEDWTLLVKVRVSQPI